MSFKSHAVEIDRTPLYNEIKPKNHYKLVLNRAVQSNLPQANSEVENSVTRLIEPPAVVYDAVFDNDNSNLRNTHMSNRS